MFMALGNFTRVHIMVFMTSDENRFWRHKNDQENDRNWMKSMNIFNQNNQNEAWKGKYQI